MKNIINELAPVIHANNVAAGWWDNPDRCIAECFQLVSTEIAEATEGVRKNLMDDKLPNRKMEEVELADTLIRLLDLAGKFGWQCLSTNWIDRQWFIDIESNGGQHFLCTTLLVKLYQDRHFAQKADVPYSELVSNILHIAKLRGYDVLSALHEKVEFNKTRKDHSREERAKENGKKF